MTLWLELPKGVSLLSNGTYKAKITVNKQVFYLGSFKTVKTAVSRYNQFVFDNGLESTYPLSVI